MTIAERDWALIARNGKDIMEDLRKRGIPIERIFNRNSCSWLRRAAIAAGQRWTILNDMAISQPALRSKWRIIAA